MHDSELIQSIKKTITELHNVKTEYQYERRPIGMSISYLTLLVDILQKNGNLLELPK